MVEELDMLHVTESETEDFEAEGLGQLVDEGRGLGLEDFVVVVNDGAGGSLDSQLV